jgi:protein-S-isoprenylcysteine O-methyltransferase Ste14
VRDPTWWIAVGLTTATALTFIVAMVAFFKSRQGVTTLRLTLCVSIAGGLTTIFGSLAGRADVTGLPVVSGSLLALAAQALFWWAVRAHGANRPSAAFATDAPSTLTQIGPYRWVRHPFYVAYVLGFAAGAAFTGQGWPWLIPAWMSALYHFAARQEETVILASPLAPAYHDYRSRVGAFVPRWK